MAVASLAAVLVLVTLPLASTVATVASLVVQTSSPWVPSGRITVSVSLAPAAKVSSVRSRVKPVAEEPEVPPGVLIEVEVLESTAGFLWNRGAMAFTTMNTAAMTRTSERISRAICTGFTGPP